MLAKVQAPVKVVTTPLAGQAADAIGMAEATKRAQRKSFIVFKNLEVNFVNRVKQ
jgi:hypothetical protein